MENKILAKSKHYPVNAVLLQEKFSSFQLKKNQLSINGYRHISIHHFLRQKDLNNKKLKSALIEFI